MSPTTKQRRIEEDLPVRRTGDELTPDSRRLKALAEPLDRPFVLWDMIQGFTERVGRMRRRSPAFSKIRLDVFWDPGGFQLTFPVLLSSTPGVEIDRNALLTEIELIIGMQQPSRFEGPHIYSVRVVTPSGYAVESVPQDLPYARQMELRSGYLSHEMLYGAPPERRAA